MPEYSNVERKIFIETARSAGMSNSQIFKIIIIGVRGADERKRLIIKWGELMGHEASAALRIAQRAGLVLTVRHPKPVEDQTRPPDTVRGRLFG
jgi:hypothetical protein